MKQPNESITKAGVVKLRFPDAFSMVLVTSLLLSACATTVDVETSHMYRPPSGTIIELKTDLTSSGALSRYTPWCEFRVARSRDVMDSPWIIAREHFVVTDSHRGIDYSALQRARESILFAGRDRVLWPTHPEVSMENMATVMNIRSETQPEVRSVVCMVFSDALYINHLSLREIRETLGEIAHSQSSTVNLTFFVDCYQLFLSSRNFRNTVFASSLSPSSGNESLNAVMTPGLCSLKNVLTFISSASVVMCAASRS